MNTQSDWKGRLALWLGLIFLLVCLGLYFFAPTVLPVVIGLLVIGVVAFVLVLGHDRWGWKGWIAVIVPMALLFVGWGAYDLAIVTSRPPVHLVEPDSCEIYKAALGIGICEEDVKAQLCDTVPNTYGGIDCKVLYEALQADQREGDGYLTTFLSKWSEYSAAKSQFMATKYEVDGGDIGLNIGILLAVFLLGIVISFIFPMVARKGGAKFICAVISVVILASGFLTWRFTRILPTGIEADNATWSLFLGGFIFEALFGSGLIILIWNTLTGGFRAHKKWQLAPAFMIAAVGLCASSSTIQTVFMLSYAANWVANSPLTISQAILSICLGQISGVGVRSFVTSFL